MDLSFDYFWFRIRHIAEDHRIILIKNKLLCFVRLGLRHVLNGFIFVLCLFLLSLFVYLYVYFYCFFSLLFFAFFPTFRLFLASVLDIRVI